MSSIYACCDEARRNLLQGHAQVTGIDFLEVVDQPTDPLDQRQTTLLVHLINAIAPAGAAALTAVVTGGERRRNIRVTTLVTGPPDAAGLVSLLRITVNEAGDFSPYTLQLLPPADPAAPLPFALDPLLATIEFSFKVNCPSEVDCQPAACPAPAPAPAPLINYLAKDYASFRQLLLDRLALLVPGWPERHPADLGLVLVELLAYVGDHLSYQQDAIGTEAYLGTARRRTSVRRHARLVDYFMHDGCNARTWVQVRVDPAAGSVLLAQEYQGQKTQLLPALPGLAGRNVLATDSAEHQQALAAGAPVFELLHDATLVGQHNELPFYTWGNVECCLPAGATSATLAGHFPDLQPGQVLVLVEAKGPRTGRPADADPAHRHAVRLTAVTPATDPLGSPADPTDPLPPGITPLVTTISWHPADALPFALCLSARNEAAVYDQVSVALGNIVLADYGLTIQEDLTSALVPDTVPPARLAYPPITDDSCAPIPARPVPARYRPRLTQGPLTYAAPYDAQRPPASARAALAWSLREVGPALTLRPLPPPGQPASGELWQPRRDLLGSPPTAREFVVEPEIDGATYLRFGDDVLGQRPATGTVFRATYRVGNGIGGNVGADTLACLVTNDSALFPNAASIIGIRNPLPAVGGMAPETLEEVRQQAPYAFRRQERAVTAADYEEMARRTDDTLQQAACTFRWTGSWRTAFLAVDRLSGLEVDAAYAQQTRARLERYRLAGYDLEVDAPRYVPLEMTLVVCVAPTYFASDVKAALLRLFTRGWQPDGRPGLFHPDRFTFGQPVYLSPFYAAAQAVAGVESVQITTFRRQGSLASDVLSAGKISLGRLEIARLDNNPNFPDRGVLQLTMRGGR